MQIPRLYNVYKEMGIVTSFQNLLDNIFVPLFEVTIDPASHPQLHVFLKQVEKTLVTRNMHIDCISALCHASTFQTSTITRYCVRLTSQCVCFVCLTCQPASVCDMEN